MRWARPISVVLLAVCYGWVLPSHRHGPAHAHAVPVERTAQAAHGPHGHHDHADDHGHDRHEGGDRGDGHGHGHAHCEVCYAAGTIYRAPDVAPAVRAPDVVAVAAPSLPERVLSVRPIPVYHGRAPPRSA